jgi:hypothetical protein
LFSYNDYEGILVSTMSSNRTIYFIRNILQNSKLSKLNFVKNKKLYKNNIIKNKTNYNLISKRNFGTSSYGFPPPNNNNKGGPYILLIMMCFQKNKKK